MTKKQTEFIMGAKFCVLATADSGARPRACIVMPEGATKDKIILADIQMGKTRDNLAVNKNVFVSFYDGELVYCVKCDGEATYHTTGELFTTTRDRLAKDNLDVKGVIEVKISSILEHKED